LVVLTQKFPSLVSVHATASFPVPPLRGGIKSANGPPFASPRPALPGVGIPRPSRPGRRPGGIEGWFLRNRPSYIGGDRIPPILLLLQPRWLFSHAHARHNAERGVHGQHRGAAVGEERQRQA